MTTNADERSGAAADRFHIHLILKADTALGRQVLAGVSDYLGPRLDWLCDLISSGRARHSPGLGPPKADAALGLIQQETAAAWNAGQRRRIVNVSRNQDHADIANVTCDDTGIGRMAADYLLGKDLRGYATVGNQANGRERAFAERVAEFDRRCRRCLFSEGGEDDDLEVFLADLPPQTGLFVFNDLLAVQVLRTAEELGRAVPEELAVVGVDNDYIQSMLAPVPITSVDPDFHRVGFRAAELLDGILKDGVDARGQCVRIPPKRVIEKGSSDFPGIADPLVIQAARLIRRYACDGLTVRELVKDLPLSRRPLEVRFRSIFGRSLLQEIHRVRVAEAARLLLQSDLPVAAIAEQSGFNRYDRLNAAFQRQIGQSPAAYRRQHRPDSAMEGGKPH